MKTNHILIDFENVQPQSFDILAQQPYKLYIFVGQQQTKVPFDLARDLQKFGHNAEYIKITGNGRNALDFHIAYYVGLLAAQDPEGHFHIISKDSGFDPLIRHLINKNIHVQRLVDLAEIPALRISNTSSMDERIMAIVKNLSGRGHSRPRKLKTLTNTINSLFTTKLDDVELSKLIDELQTRKYITISKGNISYKLPNKTNK